MCRKSDIVLYALFKLETQELKFKETVVLAEVKAPHI